MESKIFKGKVSKEFQHVRKCSHCRRIIFCKKMRVKREVVFNDVYILPVDYYFCEECSEDKHVKKFLEE